MRRPDGAVRLVMASWLKRLRDTFRAWLQANAEAHAKAKPPGCCSAPPAGAGGRDMI